MKQSFMYFRPNIATGILLGAGSLLAMLLGVCLVLVAAAGLMYLIAQSAMLFLHAAICLGVCFQGTNLSMHFSFFCVVLVLCLFIVLVARAHHNREVYCYA
jgi:hypothetical protein